MPVSKGAAGGALRLFIGKNVVVGLGLQHFQRIGLGGFILTLWVEEVICIIFEALLVFAVVGRNQLHLMWHDRVNHMIDVHLLHLDINLFKSNN